MSRRVGQSQPFGQRDALLVGHLEEEQVGDLLDVVAVVDAVVAEGVAEAPEFLDDVGHAAIASFKSVGAGRSRLPSKARFAAPQPPARAKTGTIVEVLPVDGQVLDQVRADAVQPLLLLGGERAARR